MAHVKTVRVSHLGGIDAGYQMPYPYNAKNPTLLLINSFTTTSDLYTPQFHNKDLASAVNLLAVEPLGHGKTHTKSENFTYWDSAIMNLQVLDALGIKQAFVLGTSQGGWIAARMALMGPEVVQGIIPLGTSMDYESERTRKLGCWDGREACTGPINQWTVKPGVTSPDFEPDVGYCDFLIDIGFGKDCSAETRQFWREAIRANYKGDEGRRRTRMAAINLRERDGLHGRLGDVQCPVLWLHGSADVVYSVANAEEEIKLFVNARDKGLRVVSGGAHFLSATHPKDVDEAVIEFVGKWHRGEM